MQDASSGKCPTCVSLKEQLRIEQECRKIAETSLANLRRERALENQYMAIPSEKMGAPEKLTAIALRRELVEGTHVRNEQGLANIPRAFIARRIGVKEQAAGAKIIKLEKQRLIVRDSKKDFDQTTIYVGPGPLFDAPDAVATPERVNSWGGARKPRCRHCRATKLKPTTYTCEECGCTTTAQEAIEASVTYDLEMAAQASEVPHSQNSTPAMQDAPLGDEPGDTLTLPPAQPDTLSVIQDHSTPLDMRVTPLVSCAMDSAVVAFPEAGMACTRASAERCQQQNDLYRWAEEHRWAKLAYAPGKSTGGDERSWGNFLRQAGNVDLAQARAAISPAAAEASGEEGLM